MDMGIHAERLVGGYTELMPARPTIAHHRHPCDTIRPSIDNKVADIITKLDVAIITAAEQQTMNYYMNVAGFYSSELGRKMFSEIAMIEEQHVTQYGSLMDVKCSWLTGLIEHEYVECYLYWSCMQDETDPRIKEVWETCLCQELSHLHKVAKLLEKYENKSYKDVFPTPEFPEPLTFGKDNIDYVKGVLKKTCWYTSVGEGYADVRDMDCDYPYFVWQGKLNGCGDHTPTHQVIDLYIKNFKEDFRYETSKNPVKELQDRTRDNTCVGRECKK
jgi:rubrerythrin